MDASIAPSLFVGALVDKEVRRLDIEGGQVVAEPSSPNSAVASAMSASTTATYVVEGGTNARIVRVAPTVEWQPTPSRRSQILLKSLQNLITVC